jgi:hypothetical protein
MNIEAGNRLYRSIKWLWLLLQALVLPLAALHAVSAPVRWPLALTPGIAGLLPTLLLALVGALFLIFWLIVQALLAMARFPLTLKGGALLVGGTVAQFASLVVSGGSPAAAAYAVFFATLAALIVLVAIMAVMASRRRIGSPRARMAALLALLPAVGLAWFLAAPLRPAFSRLAPGRQALEWLALALNSGLIVFSLYRFSIFAPLPDNDAAYTREWERWAAPTIIILILSATAAIVLAGFARSG